MPRDQRPWLADCVLGSGAAAPSDKIDGSDNTDRQDRQIDRGLRGEESTEDARAAADKGDEAVEEEKKKEGEEEEDRFITSLAICCCSVTNLRVSPSFLSSPGRSEPPRSLTDSNPRLPQLPSAPRPQQLSLPASVCPSPFLLLSSPPFPSPPKVDLKPARNPPPSPPPRCAPGTVPISGRCSRSHGTR